MAANHTQLLGECRWKGNLTKRATGKSALGRINFKDRFFLLTDTKLYYFDSSDLTSSTRKGSIVLKQVRHVEKLDGAQLDRKHMFQVMYEEGDNQKLQKTYMYLMASSAPEVDDWIEKLREACMLPNCRSKKAQRYHTGIYSKGAWGCCKDKASDREGCTKCLFNYTAPARPELPGRAAAAVPVQSGEVLYSPTNESSDDGGDDEDDNIADLYSQPVKGGGAASKAKGEEHHALPKKKTPNHVPGGVNPDAHDARAGGKGEQYYQNWSTPQTNPHDPLPPVPHAGGGGAPAPPRPPGGPIKGRAKAASGAGRGGEPDSCYVNDPGMVNVDAWINGRADRTVAVKALDKAGQLLGAYCIRDSSSGGNKVLTVVIEGQAPDPVEIAHYRFEKVRGGVKLLDVPQTVNTVFKDIKDCIKQLKTPKAYEWIGAVLTNCVPFP